MFPYEDVVNAFLVLLQGWVSWLGDSKDHVSVEFPSQNKGRSIRITRMMQDKSTFLAHIMSYRDGDDIRPLLEKAGFGWLGITQERIESTEYPVRALPVGFIPEELETVEISRDLATMSFEAELSLTTAYALAYGIIQSLKKQVTLTGSINYIIANIRSSSVQVRIFPCEDYAYTIYVKSNMDDRRTLLILVRV